MPEIYIEENGYYSIDCTAAVWSTNCIHDYYQDAGHKYGEIGYVLEYPNGNSTSRLMIRNLLQKKLPFRLQTQLSAGKVRLIDEVKVVNIEEWNADPELGRYPIKQRKTEESEKVKNEE